MRKLFFAFFVLTGVSAFAQKTTILRSPDKRLSCIVKSSKNGIEYKVDFNNSGVIDFSKLALHFKNPFSIDRINVSPLTTATEKYDLAVGRASHVESTFNELVVEAKEKQPGGRSIKYVFRAFNEAIAFRYEISHQQKNDSFIITKETSEFKIPGDPTVKALILPNFTSSHEGPYTTGPLSKLPSDTLLAVPALFTTKSNIYVAITEAALLDYAGMYLTKKNDVIISELSPLPSDNNISVKSTFPHQSPWRVIFVSDRFGDFLESNILTTLSPPSKIRDITWLKPGKSTFPWWNGNVTPDTLNAPGNNFVTQQYYIDFCARNNIQYHSVVEYGLHQWYVDDGVGFQPGPNSDVTKPVPGLDMKEVCDYAHSKGVGVRVWVHWAALYPKLDSAFAIFEKWGLSGMMIDFMDRDDQEMVNMQTEMLEKAAKHHLHIQFHGAYKPTGISRTYPNEFTREGTLNYEANKWGPGLTPEHDLDIAFTRLIAGSTDYHLGGFRAVPDSLYKVQYTRPLMLGTRCHMLGLYVVFENAVSMVCDYPSAYEGQQGFEFIRKVPTAWDETKVVAASIGEYLIIARRKNSDWYIGGINNSTSRNVAIPLAFLGPGLYTADEFADAKDATVDPNTVEHSSKNAKSTDTLHVHLAAGGGIAIRFMKE